MNPLLEIKHLQKNVANQVILNDINANVYKGDNISIIGPSGSGKTTLLRCLNALEVPTSGTILMHGISTNSITNLRCKIGMVFQHFNLFPHLTVLDNLLIAPTKVLHKNRQQLINEAMVLLDKMGLADKCNHYPNMLSGGQKQRVAIIRCLMMHPEIILFDEPTSALDPIMKHEILILIKKLTNTIENITTITITHEIQLMKMVSNKIWFIDSGNLIYDGGVEEFFQTTTEERIITFLQSL